MHRVVALAAALVVAVACTDRPEQAGSDRSPAPLPETALGPDTGADRNHTAEEAARSTSEPDSPPGEGPYADPDLWLCLPGRHDACAIDLDVTRIARDGTRVVEQVAPADDPRVDCFYVYPTVSEDPAPNSGREPTDAERRVVRAQFAHFAPSCRLYAPMYRQITRAALTGTADGIPDRGLAYRDVVDAWDHYLAHHNDGRGVVLVGHSQGAGHLRELLSRRIDPDPDERSLLVSAMLLGATVRTPVDASTGAHLDHIEPCTSPTEVGCVVSFSTYPADAPPGDTGFFGGVRDTDEERAVCTNPAALGGGAAPLDSIVPTHPLRDGEVSTHWVRYQGLGVGECVEEGMFHYLSVAFESADDHWPDELGGRLTPEWGLHLLDVNVALGDLVALVSTQADAHISAR